MVTFVVEPTPSNVRGYDRYQMRNEWNDDVERRSDDLRGLVGYAFEYAAYQGADVRVDAPDEGFAELADALGRDDLHGFGLGA